MFLKEKRSYHETIHDGAISVKSRLVGFLKQAKNRVSDCMVSFRQSYRVPICLLLSPSQKECETNPSRE